MKKRGLALILTLTMILSMVPITVFGSDFTDMPNNWSTAALEKAVANGLLRGDNGKIRSEDSLTRAEMATIVNRAFKSVDKSSLTNFKDLTQSDWYYEEMAKAVQMKTFVGSGNKLNPDSNITREEAFVVLARAFKISEKNTGALDGFSDQYIISDWAKDQVAALVSAGYLAGSNGQINPKNNITRAEFAQIMDNLVKTYISEEGEYTTDLNGNVMVNKAGVVLKGITITGDLIIGDGVGDGEVTLDDTTVTGRMLVRGGGEDSIKIIGNSSIKNIIIARVDGKVRVYTQDGVEVGDVTIDGNDDVILEGKFDSVTITASDLTLVAKGADIKSLSVLGTSTKITADKDSTLNKVVVSANDVKIEGKGKVKEVAANANNVSVDTKDTAVSAGKDTTGVTAGGEKVKAGEERTVGKEDAAPSGGGGGGGGGTTPDTAVKVTVVTNKEQIKAAALDSDVEKIILGDDIDLGTEYVTFTGTKTLDLAGKVLTSSNKWAVIDIGTKADVDVDLTVVDSVGTGGTTNNYEDQSRAYGMNFYNYGKLTIEGGTYNSNKAIMMVGADAELPALRSEVVINGGTFNGAIYSNGSVKNPKLTITDGIFTEQLYLAAADTETNISGGTFTLDGSASAIEIDAGILNISGGTFTNNVDTSGNKDATASNNASGEFQGVIAAIKPSGSAEGAYGSAVVVNISGGTITNTNGDAIVLVNQATTHVEGITEITVNITGGTVNGPIKNYDKAEVTASVLNIGAGATITGTQPDEVKKAIDDAAVKTFDALNTTYVKFADAEAAIKAVATNKTLDSTQITWKDMVATVTLNQGTVDLTFGHIKEYHIIKSTNQFNQALIEGKYNGDWDQLILAVNNYNVGVKDGIDMTKLTPIFEKVTEIDMSGKKETKYENGITTGVLLPFKNLETLNLSDTGITEIGGLANLTSLKNLDVSGNTLPDLGALKKLTNLETLNVSNTGIKEINVVALLTKLETLDISNNKDIKIISPLVALVSGTHALKEVNVTYTGVVDEGGKAVETTENEGEVAGWLNTIKSKVTTLTGYNPQG